MKPGKLLARTLPLLLLALLWPARGQSTLADEMALGNPSNATHNALNESNYLIQRDSYAMCYSRWDGIDRWVSWHLCAQDIGTNGRGSYTTDTSLPSGWYEAKSSETPSWSSDGFDRGHMCPSGDRTLTATANDQVFLMTNLIPQTPDNNQGPWEKLESYCRTEAQAGKELYIICGGWGFSKRISSGHVTVPSHVWKVILELPLMSGSDVQRVTSSSRIIAVDMPNIQGIRSDDWKKYRVSVDSIEANTGFDFFNNVPVPIQNVLEARVDNQ
ncbi:MAG TPA: DNA/RNA non-specific endonuclease [Armatimonadota bacterium]